MSCPVCLNPVTVPSLRGTDILFETTNRHFDLDACPACHCLFIQPPPGEQEIGSFYPAQYWWNASRPSLLKRLESIYRRLALRDHIRFIESAAARPGKAHGARLLDVGCGSGTLIGLLQRRGFSVLGLDMSAEASQVAATENGVKVVIGSLFDAGFADASFDLVTLFHVMEHVTNPRQVLAEVRRILKPNGTIVLQVPNIDSWQFRWFKAQWYGLDIPRHVIDYPRSAMEQLLRQTGFEPVRVRHFNLRDNSPALISSLFPSLDPLSRPIRQRRRKEPESAVLGWVKHAVYLGLVILSYPITLLEAASGHGATVMIEAKRG